MLKDFYVSFSAVCFTLLGLWLIVVQTRHAEWRGSARHRRRVYGVAMHFSLPGLMSLVALVDPESSALWRASFAIAAIGGAMALIALRGAAPGKLGLAAYISAITFYVMIGTLAIAPHIVGRLGFEAAPVRVEAVLLTLLVFAGVNVAWLLLFEEAPSGYASRQQGVEAHQASPEYHSGTSQGRPAAEGDHGVLSPAQAQPPRSATRSLAGSGVSQWPWQPMPTPGRARQLDRQGSAGPRDGVSQRAEWRLHARSK
jgi:hypothetical protein